MALRTGEGQDRGQAGFAVGSDRCPHGCPGGLELIGSCHGLADPSGDGWPDVLDEDGGVRQRPAQDAGVGTDQRATELQALVGSALHGGLTGGECQHHRRVGHEALELVDGQEAGEPQSWRFASWRAVAGHNDLGPPRQERRCFRKGVDWFIGGTGSRKDRVWPSGHGCGTGFRPFSDPERVLDHQHRGGSRVLTLEQVRIGDDERLRPADRPPHDPETPSPAGIIESAGVQVDGEVHAASPGGRQPDQRAEHRRRHRDHHGTRWQGAHDPPRPQAASQPPQKRSGR
jgi:hypothetical protein